MEKHTLAFYMPENNFWMIMVSFFIFKKLNKKKSLNNPYVTKIIDNKNTQEFKENDLEDTALQSVIQQSYKMFKV